MSIIFYLDGSRDTFVAQFFIFQISLEFELMNPTAAKFEDMWNVIQQKLLEKYLIDYRYMKNDLIQSLCLVREKNTIRGVKRTREEDYKENDARTLNPLHGIIDWIDVSYEDSTRVSITANNCKCCNSNNHINLTFFSQSSCLETMFNPLFLCFFFFF